MQNVPKALIWIVAIGIIVRLLLFGYLSMQNEPTYFVLGDSNGYLRLAHNIADGNGFSQVTEPPYVPDAMRVPILPLFLAASIYVFDSYVPFVILQILLSSVLIVLAYFITRLISGNETLSLITAGLMAFEPYSIYISTSILTEIVFSTFLMAGAYMALRFIREPQVHAIIAASALFGLAALTRPIGQFLPAVLIFLVLLRMPWREYLKYLSLAIIPFLIVIGPWLVRNYSIFGVAALSSSGLQNVYSDLGGAIIGVRDHIPTPEAKQQIEEDFAARYGIEMKDLQRDLTHSSDMFKEGVDIMLSNPLPTIKVFTSISITFFTHDAWTYYLQRWHILPGYETLFSPSYTLMTEGPLEAIRQSLEHAGLTLPTAVLGRLFWLVVSILFFVGIASLFLQGGVSRTYALFILSLVLYLLALSASVGFGINGRFRYPVNSIFFTGAAMGGSLIVLRLKRFFQRPSR